MGLVVPVPECSLKLQFFMKGGLKGPVPQASGAARAAEAQAWLPLCIVELYS